MDKMLIFDQDGTVIDSFTAFYMAMKETCENHGVTIGEKEYIRSKIGTHNSRDILSEYFSKNIDEIVDEYHYLLPKYEKKRKLYPGVKEVLQKLYKDYLLVMITAKSKEKAIHHCRVQGIEKFFARIEGTAITGKKEMILQLLSEYNIKKSNCVMIGDSLTDMRAGKEVGIKTILCTFGYGEKTSELLSL
ncbi:MAG: HAD family hydrolase, partial [Candidatus Heimdallarchaeaceae archaeon]